MPSTYANAGILATDPAYLGTADSPATGSHLLSVGPGCQFATLAAAVAAANNGDVIAIAGGITLTNDFVDVTQKNLTIEGVGGMVTMVATVPPPNEKGMIVIDAPDGGNVTLKNISVSGVAISAGQGGNGAGIRYDSGNLSVSNCKFTGNQDGILANADPNGTIVIDHSTFANNGSGSGFTHDIYIGEVASFTLSNSIVSSAVVGHEVKSRANNTTIVNNVIQDGPTGTGSYNIDLPNGGNAVIQGNYIEKGQNAENDVMISFGEEGNVYANSALTVNNNVFVNDLGPQAIALNNKTSVPALVGGNSFGNIAAANLAEGAAIFTANVTGGGAAIANSTQATLTPGPGVTIFADSLAHSLVFTAFGEAAQGSAGLLTITSAWGHETVYGGTGGLDYTDTGAAANEWADVITTSAGSANVITVIGGDNITSAGTDVIMLGAGNSTVVVAGTATISGGSGTEVYQVQGSGHLTVTLASGSTNKLSVASGAVATVLGGADSLVGVWQGGTLSYSITEGGQHFSATCAGGSGQVTLYQGLATIALSGGVTGSIVTLGDGTVTLSSVGSDVIHAGTGSDSIILSGNASIYAGTGQLSVYGRAETGTATIYGNGGSTLINGDSGGIKYIGDSVAAAIIDDLSKTEIDGGAGLLTITGTGYARTINGGSGGIDVLGAAGGDTISTAIGSANSISLLGGSTIVSNGTDQIICGSGNISLTANGAATITGSQGNCRYSLNGIDTLTSFGDDVIAVGAVASVQDVATGGLVTINDGGGVIALAEIKNGDQVSVTLHGAGTITAYGGSGVATITTTAGAQAAVTLQGGNDVVNSKGTDSIITGAGNDLINDSGYGDRVTVTAQQTTHSVMVDNFNANIDQLVLNGFTGSAVAGEQVTSSGLVISLTDGGTLTLAGLTVLLPVTARGALSLAIVQSPAGSHAASASSAPLIDTATAVNGAASAQVAQSGDGLHLVAAHSIDLAGYFGTSSAATFTLIA